MARTARAVATGDNPHFGAASRGCCQRQSCNGGARKRRRAASSARRHEGCAKMKGHLRERSPGHWAIILDIHDPVTGKRKRRWHSFAGGKREAQIECARLVSALTGGTYIDPSKTTLAAYLERWL